MARGGAVGGRPETEAGKKGEKGSEGRAEKSLLIVKNNEHFFLLHSRLQSFGSSLIGIEFASVAFQLVQVVTRGVVRRTRSSSEDFSTMNAGSLDRRAEVC